ncbi:hypothetical protein N8T08_005800 [Aspergillus melleus]|uniref:Uncharacterized protein n=1 Tax=Aspergillus melleus TaxID=138277 RepID=A0ACC3B1B9_9EURO|nr:hypothetical protein N8T08_005800 [Aspergillus melleus]
MTWSTSALVPIWASAFVSRGSVVISTLSPGWLVPILRHPRFIPEDEGFKADILDTFGEFQCRPAMKFRLLHVALTLLSFFLLGLGILLYSRHWSVPDADPVAYCADCLNYASRINDMIVRGSDVRGNKQFFRYACDWSCRNQLLTSGRCPKYRRGFLDRPDRYMFEVEDPPEASGCIHFFFEAYFVIKNPSLAGSDTLFGQLWKEYSLSDSRYLTSDTFLVCMEAVTAGAWGPLSFLTAYFILKQHPARHACQLILSTGQIYGDVLYYATSLLDLYTESVSYCRPEGYYFWFYYFFMNFIWMAVGTYYATQSVKAITKAFARVAEVDGEEAKKKR